MSVGRPTVARGGGPSERPELLGLLKDAEPLWRLIAVWPNVGGVGRSKAKERMVARWAKLALMREAEVRSCWELLVHNGFVRLDGTVDPVAARYVMNQMAKTVRTSRT